MSQGSQLEITSVDDADTRQTVIELSGHLDLATVRQMNAGVRRAVVDGRRDDIVVDLERLSFLGCVGLTALIAGAQLAHRHGRVLRLRSAHGTVEDVLRLTNVDVVFRLTPPITVSHGRL